MSFWSDLGDWATGKKTQQDWFGNDIAGAAQQAFGGIGPPKLSANAPGSSVDTSAADADKARQQQLISQLQQQAATGGGAWEQALAQGTQGAENTAKSLSLGQNGLSNLNRQYAGAEGAAAAQQAGVGQGNILRAREQQGAQGELSDILSSQGQQDATQAQNVANAAQSSRELQAALTEQAKTNATNAVSGAGQMVGKIAGLSSGGSVPGKPEIFGDDSRNDIVPAMLSPHEIVLPLSVASSDDPKDWVDFIAAVKNRKGGRNGHYDGGGDTGVSQGRLGDIQGNPVVDSVSSAGKGDVGGVLHAASEGLDPLQSFNKMYANPQEAPSTANGALFDLSGYNTTASQEAINNGLLAQGAAGNGLTASTQQMGNAVDAAMAGGAGHGSGVLAGIADSGRAASRGAAEGAGTKAAEQSRAQNALATSQAQQRATDINIAAAQQKQLMRNTELNAGLATAQQAQLANILSGAGQAVGMAHHLGSNTPGGPPEDNPYGPGGGAPAYNDGSYGNPDDFSSYGEATSTGPDRGSVSDLSNGDSGYAHGGIVDGETASFLRALKKRKAA